MTVETDLTFVGSIFITVSGIAAFLIAFFVWTRWDQPKKIKKQVSDEVSDEELKTKLVEKPNPFRKSAKRTKWKPDKVRDVGYSHPWLLTTLKGHVNRVLDVDFSPNGKFLISVCDDRTMFLWNIKDFHEREHKFSRGSVDLDNGSRVVFGPDSKSVLLSLQMNNKLSVYKVVKNEERGRGYRLLPVETVDFPEEHTRDINGIGFACNGRFVMSSSEDSKLVVYSIHGDLLKVVEPKLNILYEALVTPCGRFIASSGFTPDVLVFEVLFDRQGNFLDVKRAFELKGHTSGIPSFAFNQNSSRCVTVSKDGTWRLYDTNIRYSQGEEAKTIVSGEWDLLRNAAPESVSVAMSASGNSFAVGASRHVHLFSAVDEGKKFDLILDVHQEMISRVRISPCGKMVASCGDRYIRIFHNVAEYYSDVVTLEKALTESRQNAQKRRIEEQLEEARKALDKVLGN